MIAVDKVALLTAPVTVDETDPSVHLNVLPVTPSAVEISLVLPLQKLLYGYVCAVIFEEQKIPIKKKVIPNAILMLALKRSKLLIFNY